MLRPSSPPKPRRTSKATADNPSLFFVNGEIIGSTTLLPSNTGGTQIGTEQENLDRLNGFSGVADVQTGENTLYAVVRDRYVLDPVTNIGGYGQTGLLVSSVPKPGALTSLLAGTACLLIGAQWRRVRRPRRRRDEPSQRGPSD